MKQGDKPPKPEKSPRLQPPLNLAHQASAATVGQLQRSNSIQNDSQSIGTAHFGANSGMAAA